MSNRQLPNWLDSYMEFVNNSEPPKIYHKWVAISTLASALQGKVWVEWEKQVFPNQYIILVGPSAECRKGTSMGPAKLFLREIGCRVAPQSITREAFIQKLSQALSTFTSPKTQESFFHSSITVFSEELSVFLNKATLQLMADLTDLYDCPRPQWDYQTKHGKEEPVTNPCVNILGATTPGMLKASFPATEAVSGGFTSRCIFVFANKREKIVPFPIKDAQAQILGAKLVADLGEISLLSGQCKMDSDFLESYGKWYTWFAENIPQEDPNFVAYYNRKQTHLFKLSIAMSVSRSDELVLRKTDFDRAINLLHETELRMRHCFGEVGSAKNLECLTRILHTIRSKKRITFRELLSIHYRDVSSVPELQATLQVLETMRAIRQVVSGQHTVIEFLSDVLEKPSGGSDAETPSNS